MNKDEKKKLIGFAISNGVTLLAGFISGMGTNIASRHQDNLSIEYQNIKNQNDVLLSEISSLQKELEILTAENETLRSQSNNAKSFIDQPNTNKSNRINLYDTLKIDSNHYELIRNFPDSTGNVYSMVYKFDASLNAYAKFKLEQPYNTLSGYILTGLNIGNDVDMTIEIYGDEDIILKRIGHITKDSGIIPLESIDISGIEKLTINTYNIGKFYCGYLYLADITLE